MKWGTKEGNEDFSFQHFKFEMSFRYSYGDAESAVGYFRLGFRGEFPERIKKLGVIILLMVFKSMQLEEIM